MSEVSDVARAIENALHDLGLNDDSMARDRPYDGQPWTCTGVRGATEIHGVTFRDLRDCFIRAVMLSTGAQGFPGADALYAEAEKGADAMLAWNDLYKVNLNDLDPGAIAQNLSCEVERLMGIFPNVPAMEQAQ